MEKVLDVRTMGLEEMRKHVAELLRVNRQLIEENKRLKALLEDMEDTRRKFSIASRVGALAIPAILFLGIALKFINP